jgi:hypothetical protein
VSEQAADNAVDNSVSRVEAKHIASDPQVGVLKKHVTPLLKPDAHGPEYEVSTVYHDTPGRDCFKAADERYPDRFKIRSRTYNGKGSPIHELKANKGLFTLKRNLSDGEFQRAVRGLGLEPAVEVKYDREAFEDEVDGEPFRMTIDRGVRSRTPGKSKWTDVLPKGTMVVELKTPHEMNRFARRIVSLGQLERIPISKFVASLRKLHG